MESQKEVNTEYLFSKIRQQNKKLVVSKSDFDTYSMQHFLWSCLQCHASGNNAQHEAY